MAITGLGLNAGSRLHKGAKAVYAHVSDAISYVRKDVPDAFVHRLKVQKSKESITSKITEKIKGLFSSGKKAPAGEAYENTKVFRPAQNKTIKQVIQEKTASLKSLKDDVTSKIKAKTSKFKAKTAKMLDEIPENFSRLKASAYKSFENFKKYVDQSPMTKFFKTLIKNEEKKVERIIKERYIENKNDLIMQKKRFEAAKAEFAEKFKNLKKALSSGNKELINKAKDALSGAKSALENAKAYLDIAAEYFQRSAKTAGIKADNINI